MKKSLTLLFLCISVICSAQLLPPVFSGKNTPDNSPLATKYLSPAKIVWQSDSGVLHANKILNTGIHQADLTSGECLVLTNHASIILDFGFEIQGGIQIVTTKNNTNPSAKIRIRFGESVGETCSNIGTNGATNDHAIRDLETTLPWLGTLDIGNTGFRFVRIDLLSEDVRLEIKEINAKLTYRDIPYLGSFESNDERLNKIWMTGAYTVHLNMQEYLWDGIKRDRLVWAGDLHPEIMTICSVFGKNEVVPKSLDLIRDLTPLPQWMNGISSYSMWWILIQKDWYLYNGDLEYLKQQGPYLASLLKQLTHKIDVNGKENLDGWRFLDWPSSRDPDAIHTGLQSLLKMTFEAGIYLSENLNDKESLEVCRTALHKMSVYKPKITNVKQADALLAISNLVSPELINKEVLSKNGTQGMSTFYGYYMMNARAEAGDISGALANIREYWGGMIDLGATTFWEDFNVDWAKNAARIDEMIDGKKIDIHATYGAYCYKGYRHSFCHGWASGPTAWLTKYILGVTPLEPGCKKVKIKPNLGDLEWVKGTFPTPYGVIKIEHSKNKNGEVITKIDAPKEIEVSIIKN